MIEKNDSRECYAPLTKQGSNAPAYMHNILGTSSSDPSHYATIRRLSIQHHTSYAGSSRQHEQAGLSRE